MVLDPWKKKQKTPVIPCSTYRQKPLLTLKEKIVEAESGLFFLIDSDYFKHCFKEVYGVFSNNT